MKKMNLALLINFSILMILTGVSDSIRGVFLPTFQLHFNLNSTQSSLIIMMSYIGNLIFLLFGGYFVDRFKKKTVVICIMAIWMTSFIIYALTDNYLCLMGGMIFSMGASTLLSTTINVLTPVMFASSPGFIINLFGFIQGIGTSGSQNIIGKYADNINLWHTVNIGLFTLSVLILLFLILFAKFPEQKYNQKSQKISYRSIMRNKAFLYMVMIFGFYFIAEHGIMNWMTTYATKELGYTLSEGSMYLSLFFLGITIGRLIISPLVDKIGVFRAFSIFALLTAVFYIVGMLFGKSTIILLSIAGLFCAILYPTLVLMVGYFFPEGTIATATGTIISIATFFDIAFNLFFGSIIDALGFRIAILILPISMAAFCFCYFWFRKKVPALK